MILSILLLPVAGSAGRATGRADIRILRPDIQTLLCVIHKAVQVPFGRRQILTLKEKMQ
jgi:hypothetical protein